MKWLIPFLLVSSAARADILFIDENNAPGEIAAAQRAADARGERLIVFPSDVDEATRRNVDQKTDALNKAKDTYDNRCANAVDSTSCHQLAAEISGLNRAELDASAGHRITPVNLKSFLQDLQSKGVNVTSAVVSSHQGKGNAYGAFADLTTRDLSSAFSGAPKLQAGIRSVALWGCYTTDTGSVDGNWKQVFPNTKLIAGFQDVGPGKNQPSNHTYLEDFLKSDQQWLATDDKAQMVALSKRIRNFGVMNSAIWVSTPDCAAGQWITPSGDKTRMGLQNKCNLNGRVKPMLDDYNCYMKAVQPRCANPPTDLGAGHSLPDLYESVASQECQDYWEQQIDYRNVPKITAIQNLMNFSQIKAEVAGLGGGRDLANFDQILSNAGVPESAQFSNLASMSRAQILSQIKVAQRALNAQGQAGAGQQPQVLAAQRALNRFRDTMDSMANKPADFHQTMLAVGSGAAGAGYQPRSNNLAAVSVEPLPSDSSALRNLKAQYQEAHKRWEDARANSDEANRVQALSDEAQLKRAIRSLQQGSGQ